MPTIQKIHSHTSPFTLQRTKEALPMQREKLPVEAKCASPSNLIANTPIQNDDDNKSLGNGWYKISPLLNGWAKVFDTGRTIPQTTWIVVWVKEPASIFLGVPHDPVPKKSLIYQYISSNNPEKKKVIERFEKLMVENLLSAKDFLGGKGLLTQTGIEIASQAKRKDGKEYFMTVKGLYGIEIAYSDVDTFLEIIEGGNKEKIQKCAVYFKGGLVHEMTHFLRNEFSDDFDSGVEIASHAVEMLSSMGDNPLKDEQFELAMQPEYQDDRYCKDMITALKVVQQKLIEYGYCNYDPQNHTPDEINKAIKSIDEDDRYKVLQNIADEIIKMPAIDLLRAAANIGIEPPIEFEFEFELD